MATDVRAGEVDVGEFRENLDHFLESSGPVRVTRDGEVIGVYTPVPRFRGARSGEADRQALRAAGEQVDAMLGAAGISEEDAIHEAEEILLSRKRRSAG